MDWRLGTMGFGYKDWADVFYPHGMKSADYLSHYAKCFDSVELDTTFYGTPDRKRVEKWISDVPEHFRFCAKTPRDITHAADLIPTIPLMSEFLSEMRRMKEKLGVILLQFPPSFSIERLGELKEFIAQLPKDIRFAVEFRSRSWWTHSTDVALKEHNICWASADYEGEPAAIRRTADFLYIRWIGAHQRFAVLNREQVDPSDALKWWQKQIAQHASDVRTAWGFFNNDYAGYSVATCRRFQKLIGVPISSPPETQTGSLF